MIGFSLHFSADVIKKSKNISSSYLRNEFNLIPILRRQFKICRPIQNSISNFTRVKIQTFPNITSQIVVANVVDLLLLVRS